MAIVWCMMYKLHVRQQLWNFQVRNDADLMVHSKKKHFFHSIFSEKKGLMERIPKRQTFLSIHARSRSLRIHIKHPNELKQISKRWKPRTKYNRSTAVIYYIACFTPLASIFHIKKHRDFRLHALISFSFLMKTIKFTCLNFPVFSFENFTKNFMKVKMLELSVALLKWKKVEKRLCAPPKWNGHFKSMNSYEMNPAIWHLIELN